MHEIKKDSGLKLQIIATGAHLSRDFALSYKDIEKDNFKINAKVSILSTPITPKNNAIAVGRATIGFARAFSNLNPDIVVVLGDRYEMLAAASAATLMGIPIAHLYGGESSEGAIDENIRHAITKMSHLHFANTKLYAQKIKQMGEEPWRVFNYGAPGLDNIKRLKLINKKDLAEKLQLDFSKKNILVTYHPVTLAARESEEHFKNILKALEDFNANIIFTEPNADAGRTSIIKLMHNFAKKHSNSKIFANLGTLNYLSLLKCVDVMLGNSSSGLLEAPSFKLPAINVGMRQEGRIKAVNVIDCSGSVSDIKLSLKKALSEKFKKSLAKCINPYQGHNASLKIVKALKAVTLGSGLLTKKFIIYK
jgi:GDP/UDP-N,N'-diacetylbacillosamine 2-epimerase (hydrolysing)